MRAHSELFRRFFRIMAVERWHVLVPTFLAIVAAGLDGIAMALLVPLARGIAGDSFVTLWSLPVFRDLEATFLEIPVVANAPNRATFLLLVVLILSANIGRILLNYVSQVTVDYRQGVYTARVKSYTFARFLTFGKLYFDRHSQGKIGRLLGYANAVPELFGKSLGSVNALLRLLAHIAVLLTISWRLTLLIALVFPVIYLGMRSILDRIQSISESVTGEELELSRKVFNLFSSIPLVKSYARERDSVSRYQSMLERLRALSIRHSAWARLVAPLQAGIVVVSLIVIAAVAVAFSETDNPAELSTFCAFLLIARQTLPMLTTLSDLRAQWARMGPRLDQLAEIFDVRDKFVVDGGPRQFVGLHEAIRFNCLSFAYEDKAVLQDVTATLPARRWTAIVGPTGSGKSTLVGLLARFYDCPDDSILLDGTDLREFSLESLATKFAIVNQDVLLFNDTLRANLVFGLDRDVTDVELNGVIERTRLAAFVDQLPKGLETRVGDRGVRLSGGEKQRVSIARALLKQADIIVFDEATSALDSRTEFDVYQEIQQALAGKTVIVIAHRLSTVRDAEQILVLEEGRLVEYGDWPTLIEARGTFYELWKAQVSEEVEPGNKPDFPRSVRRRAE